MSTVLVLRHVQRCSLGSIATHLMNAGLGYCYVDLYAHTPKRMPFDKASGLIVLGGPMTANDTDEYPFLLAELDWINAVLN